MRTKIAPTLLVAVLSFAALAAPARAGFQMPPDCNGDGIVSISELSIVANILLGKTELSQCPPADVTGDGVVRIDELTNATIAALFGAGGMEARRFDETCSDGVINVEAAANTLELPAPALSIGSAHGPAGGQVQVDVDINTMGQPVVASQNDIIFDPAVVDLMGATPCINLATGKSIATAVVTCPGPASDPCPPGSDGKKRLRAVTVGSNSPTTLITDGSALYRCTFTISAAAPIGSATLTCANAIAALYGNPPTPTLTGLATATLTATIEPSATVTPVPPTTTVTAEPSPTATLPAATATATATVTLPVCVGDCNLDHRVLIDELIKGVNIALGSTPPTACPPIDCHGDGHVTVDCLIRAVNAALTSCPTE